MYVYSTHTTPLIKLRHFIICSPYERHTDPMHKKHNKVNININLPPFPRIPTPAECENSRTGGINLIICKDGFVCTCVQQPIHTQFWLAVQMCAMVITINIICFIGPVQLINVAVMQIQFLPHMVRYPSLLS